MSRFIPWCLVVALTAALIVSHWPVTGQESVAVAAEQKQAEAEDVAVFDTAELVKNRKESGKAWTPFLRSSALYCGMYGLAKGAKDGQSPHGEDEVYYVLSGKAKIQTGTGDTQKTTDVKTGSVIYIKAGIEHRFVDISEDLELLVFFSTAKPKE